MDGAFRRCESPEGNPVCLVCRDHPSYGPDLGSDEAVNVQTILLNKGAATSEAANFGENGVEEGPRDQHR